MERFLFLVSIHLGFLQQRLAAGPTTGHQSVSQQSMMRPISRRLKIPKSLAPVVGPASEEEPALRAWRDGKIAMISSALLCSGSSSSGWWLLPLLLALLGILGPRTARRSTAASHLEPVYRLPPIHPSSFNEREHCWTDYEKPSSFTLLLLELSRQASDWQHRPTEHCFLAVRSGAVHKQAAAADRVKHDNKFRPLAPFHSLCLLTTASRLWRSNQN